MYDIIFADNSRIATRVRLKSMLCSLDIPGAPDLL